MPTNALRRKPAAAAARVRRRPRSAASCGAQRHAAPQWRRRQQRRAAQCARGGVRVQRAVPSVRRAVLSQPRVQRARSARAARCSTKMALPQAAVRLLHAHAFSLCHVFAS